MSRSRSKQSQSASKTLSAVRSKESSYDLRDSKMVERVLTDIRKKERSQSSRKGKQGFSLLRLLGLRVG